MTKPLTTADGRMYVLAPSGTICAVLKLTRWELVVDIDIDPNSVRGSITGVCLHGKQALYDAVTAYQPSLVLLRLSAKHYAEGPAWIDFLEASQSENPIKLKFIASHTWKVHMGGLIPSIPVSPFKPHGTSPVRRSKSPPLRKRTAIERTTNSGKKR